MRKKPITCESIAVIGFCVRVTNLAIQRRIALY